MNTLSDRSLRHARLRSLAQAQLSVSVGNAPPLPDASDALRVLFELASTPATAAKALALLHELQVHQVEVDLQDEELRQARAELERSLQRHVELFEYAPSGYLTLDRQLLIQELNPAAANLLRVERQVMVGRALVRYLVPDSVPLLRTVLFAVLEEGRVERTDLDLLDHNGGSRRVHVSARLDPAGGGYLLGMMERC